MTELKKLKNDCLIFNLKNLVGEERKILNQILEYLHEVNSRKLYLDMAYPTLFEFCTRELGYSKASAFRRVEALKLLKSLPEENQIILKTKIQEGHLNLTHLTQVQSFFKTERKINNKNYSNQEKLSILKSLEDKSKLETEKILVQISPQALPEKLETIRYINKDKIEVKTIIDSDLMGKLEKLKALKSHINPSMTLAELIRILADRELKRIDPMLRVSKKCGAA